MNLKFILINLDHRLSRVSASSFSNRIGNCRGHSNEGKFPCVIAVRLELFRNIWLVLRASNHATLKIENDYGLVHLVRQYLVTSTAPVIYIEGF